MPEVHRILRQIVNRRRRRLEEEGLDPGAAASIVAAEDAARPLDADGNAFLAALAGRRGRAVIAEVKMGSPRLGSLAGRIDPERQARIYGDHGAAALSVVVEPDHFHGSYELLSRCREVSGLPAIAKDFVVHPRQIDLAVEAGASAVLLIAALMTPRELAGYAARARRRGLVPLVELHHRAELERLADGAWELLGINNRSLETFDVDLEHSIGLVDELPAGALRVAESGIAGAPEVERLRRAGFDAFLIGESLLLAQEPAALLEEMAR
jgi:indole-3-glycerol phosphate synthase